MITQLSRLRFEDPWSGEVVSWADSGGRLVVRREDIAAVTVELTRCARGRLRHAYPVAAHDVEVRVSDVATADDLTAVLEVLTPAIRIADPQCRKVVYAVDRDDSGRSPLSALATSAAAEAAGFRYVVDVDIADAELSLLVAEPDWVTAVDIDLDHVPGT
ncbi:hypothetical protein [Rhodococcus sp. USK13]|uniref:hypothetical protein n=1 Tax=Rhodococcus sp. USK13 TaxID=2806442 RepID=UPI001BCC7409|nr:hypothetical protein [Rhodococcus sp. USK13]